MIQNPPMNNRDGSSPSLGTIKPAFAGFFVSAD